MAAEFKEAVVTTDTFKPEQLLPDLGNHLFHRTLRRLVGTACVGVLARFGQGAAIQLAVGGQRQGLQHHKGARYHMAGQAAQQLGTQCFGRCRLTAQIGHQALVALVLAGNDRRFADTGKGGENRFDFPQLDAQATDLHLVVVAAQVFQGAVGQPATDVAGLVQAGVGPIRERVGDKAFGAEFREVQVATGDADTTDMDFATDTHRQQLTQVVQDMQLHIADRLADRHRAILVGRQVAVRLVPGNHIAALGRTVAVDHHGARLSEFFQHGDLNRLAPQYHPFQARQGLIGVRLYQRVESARRHIEVGQAGRGDLRDDGIRVEGFFGQVQRGADHQRGKDVFLGQVEVVGGGQQHRIPGMQRQVFEVPVQQVAQAAMFHHHALGQPGGARGVDHVGQMAEVQCRDLWVVIRHVEQCRVVQFKGGQACGQWQFVQPLLEHQGPWGAVGEHMGQAVRRVLRVQWHVGGTGLEDTEQADDHFRAATGAQADGIVWAHSQGDQTMGNTVGPGIELGVTEGLPGADQRHGVWSERRLCLEDTLWQTLRVFVQDRLGRIEGLQQLLALLGIEQWQVRQWLGDIAQQGIEQLQQVAAPALDGAFIEQVGGVFELAVDAFPVVVERQAQVDLGGAGGLGQWRQFQAGQGQDLVTRRIAEYQHRLEQRAVGQAALRLQGFDHLFERQVLMAVGVEGDGLDLRQQLVDATVGLDIDAQGQGVDEEADQRFGFLARTVGHRGADHDLRLIAQAREQDRPGRQQGHKWGQALLPAELPQPVAERRRQFQCQGGATVALHLRPWVIGGQFQQAWRTAEVLAPETGLGLQAFALQVLLLPGRVVGVLQGQRRQRIVETLAEGAVQAVEFVDQHRHGPAIGDDMVLGDQQDMFVFGQLQQASANQRALAQIERRLDFGQAQLLDLLLPGLVGEGTEVVLGQGKADVFASKVLTDFIVLPFKGGAQAFVAGNDAVQGPLQGLTVELAAQVQGRRHVVGDAGGMVQLVEEPQPLLGQGQRQVLVAGCHFNWLELRAGGPVHGFGQGRQGTQAEQIAQIDLDAKVLVQTGLQLHSQQRVAAEFEEVVLTTDPFQAQQIGPDNGQALFGLALRRFVFAAGQCGAFRRRQRFTVDFAVGRQWQGVELYIGRRDHVLRQRVLQMAAQAFGLQQRLRLLRGEVGHQAFFTRMVFSCQYHAFLDPGISGETGFDFPQFDAETTDLHLVVITPQVFEGAVRQITSEVAGAVHTGRSVLAERILEEAFGGQVVAVQVAASHARATDIQLTRHTQRYRPAVFVQQVGLCVGHRFADRHEDRFALFIDARDTGPDGGLRRAVEVPQFTAARQQFTSQAAGKGFATAENAQVPIAGPAAAHQHLPGGRGGLHHADPLLFKQALQLQAVHGCLAGGQDHTAAVDQGQVQLKRGDIEGNGGDGEQAILRRKPRFPACGEKEVAQGPMGDLYALRIAGGARGVNHIGQMFSA